MAIAEKLLEIIQNLEEMTERKNKFLKINEGIVADLKNSTIHLDNEIDGIDATIALVEDLRVLMETS